MGVEVAVFQAVVGGAVFGGGGDSLQGGVGPTRTELPGQPQKPVGDGAINEVERKRMGLVEVAWKLAVLEARIAQVGSMGFPGRGQCVRCPPVQAFAGVASEKEFDAPGGASFRDRPDPKRGRIARAMHRIHMVYLRYSK